MSLSYIFRSLRHSSGGSCGDSPADIRGAVLTNGELNGEPAESTCRRNSKTAINSLSNAGQIHTHTNLPTHKLTQAALKYDHYAL